MLDVRGYIHVVLQDEEEILSRLNGICNCYVEAWLF